MSQTSTSLQTSAEAYKAAQREVASLLRGALDSGAPDEVVDALEDAVHMLSDAARDAGQEG